MLAIRLQRTGRTGLAQYRVIVQDSHRSPTSGRVVAYLGSYNPHSKTVTVKKDQAQFYLDHGAQPSERVANLLKSEGVTLPKWVTFSEPKKRTTRNAEKLCKNQPAEAKAEKPSTQETPASADPSAEAPAKVEEALVEENSEAPIAAETTAEEKAPKAPAETTEVPEEPKAEKA